MNQRITYCWKVWFSNGTSRMVTADTKVAAMRTAVSAERLVNTKLKGRLTARSAERMHLVGTPPLFLPGEIEQ